MTPLNKRVQTNSKFLAGVQKHVDLYAKETFHATRLSILVKVKVKQSRYRPGVAQRVPGS
jgi:hypothetical protein